MVKNLTKYRYERKFCIPELTFEYIKALIFSHPSHFSVSYPLRIINNIYLDTANLDFFNDTIIGCSDRKKVRIRWYGDTSTSTIVNSPKLEIKCKSGFVGWKLLFPLKQFMFDRYYNYERIQKIFKE